MQPRSFYNDIDVPSSFFVGQRLRQNHPSVKYRESSVKEEDVRAGTIPREEQERCGTCAYWRYGLCQLVEGSIDAFFTCKLWELPVRTFREGGSQEIVEMCDNERGVHRLFFELKADPAAKTWIPYLPKPEKYKHKKYGDIVITESRNLHFVTQFEDRVYGQDLPIDMEHETEIDGEGHRTVKPEHTIGGYIRKMRQNVDGSVDAFVEWTKAGVEVVKSGALKYFSPQWLEGYRDNKGKLHTDVAVGGALTATPYFKETDLRPLVSTAEALVSRSPGGVGTEYRFSSKEEHVTVKKDPKDAKDDDKNKGFLTSLMERIGFKGSEDEFVDRLKPLVEDGDPADPGDGSFADGDEVMISASELADFRKLQKENKELRTMSEKNAVDTKSMSERLATMEHDKLERKFGDVYEGKDPASGDLDPECHFAGAREKKVKFMIALSEKFGADSDELKEYIAEQRTHAKQLATSDLLKEFGVVGEGATDGSAYAQLQVKANAILEKGDAKNFNEALTLAEDRNPTLREQHTKEMRR